MSADCWLTEADLRIDDDALELRLGPRDLVCSAGESASPRGLVASFYCRKVIFPVGSERDLKAANGTDAQSRAVNIPQRTPFSGDSQPGLKKFGEQLPIP